MTFEAFQLSLQQDQPPALPTPLLTALWYDGKGDWRSAHDIVETMNSSNAAWIHAYLHRVEGDHWNANYWYSRAGREMPDFSLKEEWEALVQAFLEKG